MSCLTNSGIAKGCDKSSGGIVNIWITSYSNLVDKDSIEYDADGVISGLTSALSATTELYLYATQKETAFVNEEPTFEGVDGSTGFDQQLYMKFKKLDSSKRNELKYLTSTPTLAIVEDRNGEFRMLGINGGLLPSSVRTQTGAAIAEGNFFEITLNDQSPELAPHIDSKTVFSSFIA